PPTLRPPRAATRARRGAEVVVRPAEDGALLPLQWPGGRDRTLPHHASGDLRGERKFGKPRPRKLHAVALRPLTPRGPDGLREISCTPNVRWCSRPPVPFCPSGCHGAAWHLSA